MPTCLDSEILLQHPFINSQENKIMIGEILINTI